MNQNLEHQKNIAKNELKKLVDNFNEHIESYKASDYNEASLRIDYLNKLFKILGWDVENDKNLPPSYREVITEDKVQIEGRAKAPDYSFRLENGKRLFFAEAKKPSVNISKHADSAFQLRRYGWSADLPVSILTNFEYLSIYDCTVKPINSDPVKKAQLKIISYEEYLDEFDYIWDRFSKEAILNDSLITYFGAKKKKRGSASVDEDFLNSLDEWRIALAKDINKNNSLDEDQINFIVQQTIDRIIFLRIAEDRDVEDYGAIQKCLDNEGHYKNLHRFFEKADQKYNSGLFKKDELSAKVKISDSIISKIINGLYYPQSPYEFSVLPIEILGKAYEQFLGKKITLTDSGRIKIEDKPEVKKAGGVYYTPKYIVDYIVQNTVGKICEGKTPEQVTKIKILDPASGSGSFLLGAYEYLLQWYKDYFTKNPIKYAKRKMSEILTPTGELTTRFKGKVLLDNIYGVDIDANAVEVTKLSLLLKCMEGETKETIHAQQSFFHERILPTLDENIKCGNSLIDFDIYSKFLTHTEDRKVRKKINAFHWEDSFKEVFRSGGFDLIVGNPPWGAGLLDSELRYLREKHQEIIMRMVDTFMYFVNASITLLKTDGFFGMILPDVFLYQVDNSKLRNKLILKTHIMNIINMGNVFEKVVRPTSILIFKKCENIKKDNEIAAINVSSMNGEVKIKSIFDQNSYERYAQSELLNMHNCLFVTRDIEHYKILEKIKASTIPLSTLLDSDGIQRGISPDLKDAFLIDSATAKKYKIEKEKLRPTLTGGIHVKKYSILYPDLQVIYTNRNDNFRKLPQIRHYIDQYKNKITCKEVQQGKHPIYALHRPRKEHIFLKKEKIVGVITEDQIIVAIDSKQTFVTDGLYFFSTENVSLRYLMGLLNSKLFVFLYRLLSTEQGRVLAQVKPTIIAHLPIKTLDNSDAQKMEVINYVKRLERLSSEILSNNANGQKSKIDEEYRYNENSLDQLIYKLYGLTKHEISIVEKSVI